MRSLARALDRFAEATGDEVTVVFDKRADGLDPSHVEVVFARWKGRNAADHEIEVMVDEDPAPSEISVVTSDKRLVDRVTEAGARVMPAGRFRKRLETFEGDDGRG